MTQSIGHRVGGYPAGMTDPAERDLSAAEDLDDDRLQLDSLEAGMDPPEHWSEADRYGMTVAEQRQGQDLDHRLREEEPDVDPDGDGGGLDPDDVPDDALDDSFDDRVADRPDESFRHPTTDAMTLGRSADEAGGSMADEIRTPHDRSR